MSQTLRSYFVDRSPETARKRSIDSGQSLWRGISSCSAWIASPVQHHGSAERDRGGCPSVASAPAPALQDAESPVSSCCTISATWARRHPTVAPTIVDGIIFVLAAYFHCRCHWLTQASLRARCFVVLRPTQGGASSLVRLL